MELCFECEKPAYQEHHVVPVSQGGTKTVPLCEDCHTKVHGKSMHIADLTKSAMQRMRTEGLYTGGPVPYGFTAKADGKLSPVAREQTTIARAKELRAAGMALRAVSATLASEGRLSRTKKPFLAQQIKSMIGAE